MIRHRSSFAVASLFLANTLIGQQPSAMNSEACAKHCREMAASQEKAVAERKAAWKEIEAQLQTAKNAQGDKKIAALESAVEKLIAYQASTPAEPSGCPMAGHAMACCGGDAKSAHGAGTMGHAGHEEHCPMMKGTSAPSETPKPSH
ncbi:MAG TPA: hypothetical protein VFA98_12650 [Thermoanaerobaculia bacterium]|nr:hypothetical protein [Thermoanaerobaculia bacterium]